METLTCEFVRHFERTQKCGVQPERPAAGENAVAKDRGGIEFSLQTETYGLPRAVDDQQEAKVIELSRLREHLVLELFRGFPFLSGLSIRQFSCSCRGKKLLFEVCVPVLLPREGGRRRKSRDDPRVHVAVLECVDGLDLLLDFVLHHLVKGFASFVGEVNLGDAQVTLDVKNGTNALDELLPVVFTEEKRIDRVVRVVGAVRTVRHDVYFAVAYSFPLARDVLPNV